MTLSMVNLFIYSIYVITPEIVINKVEMLLLLTVIIFYLAWKENYFALKVSRIPDIFSIPKAERNISRKSSLGDTPTRYFERSGLSFGQNSPLSYRGILIEEH